VDFIVVDPAQRQTYQTHYDPSYSGELKVPLSQIKSLPFGPRKIIVRRAALELFPGAICNLGAGISTGLSTVAAEEDVLERVILTNEQGLIGGAPITGRDSGGAQNFAAMIDQPYQFDFYDGGGLDLAFLSFAEVDPQGNVNVSRFGDKIVGVGGFINISQNAKYVIFSGTLTAGDLDVQWLEGRIHIAREGKHRKFVPKVEQICYNAKLARESGRKVLYVTERAVFISGDKGLTLVEVAPGVDVQRDVVAQMGFVPVISPDLREMDPRIFQPDLMGLGEDLAQQSPRYRTEKLATWLRERA
jgi:propionate CoA-transferase